MLYSGDECYYGSSTHLEIPTLPSYCTITETVSRGHFSFISHLDVPRLPV